MEAVKEGKLLSIKHYVKRLLFISFVVLILDIFISFISITLVQQQSAQYLRNTADLYIDRINNNFSYLNLFMGSTLANDEDLEMMNESNINDADFIKSNRNLYRRYAELKQSLGAEFNFFVYLKNNDYFSNFAPMSLSYPEYEALRAQIIASIDNGTSYDKYSLHWSTINLNENSYIIKIVPYYDSFMISLISAEKLIAPLQELDLGKEGYITLIGMDNESITNPVPKQSKLLQLMQLGTIVNRNFTNATFNVQLVIQFGAFEKIMVAQLLVVFLAILIACFLCFIMLDFLKKVLIPIKNFSKNLTVMTNSSEPINMENSKIFELERANTQFNHMVRQLREIKIEMYERELEKQDMQIRYMKLQIQPHFFLNCLTTIYSMSQMHMYDEIQKMTLAISNYFRYIFQSDSNFVKLKDELEHIRIYMDIQKQRYHQTFQYHIQLDSKAEDTAVPPLVLQTFIENIMKYAVSRDQEIDIFITINHILLEQEPITYIRIADTGPGFPIDVLNKLQNKEYLDQTHGKHIGIMNTIQRLEYLYKHKASIRFSNIDSNGACVELWLPTEQEELS
ncbi:MAG TPA: histidine kinase [Candidatus Paenibacillus intestinavium]|nr:histidine kinase [Candidatus Paenibacillus intestinavium]